MQKKLLAKTFSLQVAILKEQGWDLATNLVPRLNSYGLHTNEDISLEKITFKIFIEQAK